METLFTTELNVNGVQTSYNVRFHDEAYYFEPSEPGSASFSIKRENDQWIKNDKVDNQLISAAISALDKYLLSQH